MIAASILLNAVSIDTSPDERSEHLHDLLLDVVILLLRGGLAT